MQEVKTYKKNDLLIYYLGTNQIFYENNIGVTNRFAELDIFCMRKLIRNKQNEICPTLVTQRSLPGRLAQLCWRDEKLLEWAEPRDCTLSLCVRETERAVERGSQ